MIIQGGMGVAVSGWKLARAVSLEGQLGVVSGTGIDAVMVRRLQLGDAGGHIRRAFDAFPLPEIADRVWAHYFTPSGKPPQSAFKSKPVYTFPMSASVTELLVLANFVEVFLAKEGHCGVVGINLLEKIQLGTLPSLLGAMLAGVDYVLMGAGIPREIPAALDQFAKGETASLNLDVAGAAAGEFKATLDPTPFTAGGHLSRPHFLAIVSSSTLAITLARKCSAKVDGFVVEGFTAGGHNAPPRGAATFDESGQPIYGPRDNPDLEQFRSLGLPFWLAGSFGSADKLKDALDLGANGIQVGTAFAFSDESGIDADIKLEVIRRSLAGSTSIHTDAAASPTGFPFKVLAVEGSLSEQGVYDDRPRTCDLGYLRQLYVAPSGKIGFRCSAEPVEDYVSKGGAEEDTLARKCLCNGLLSTVGLGQQRKSGYSEPPLVTAGDDVTSVGSFVQGSSSSYSAKDVIHALLGC